MKKAKIIVAGGGTAGHIFPTISVVLALKKIYHDNIDVLYLGDRHGPDREIIKKLGIAFCGLFAGKWRRYFSWANFFTPILTSIGIIQCFWQFIKYQPDVVFTKGGYVSIIVGIVARIFFKPLVIHESDAIMGISNRILSRWAKTIAVAFPINYYRSKYVKKMIYVGNPIREEFYKVNYLTARQKLYISQESWVILAMGGSQGAHHINTLIFEIIQKLLNKSIVIHITGKLDFQSAQDLRNNLPKDLQNNYYIYDFLSNNIAQYQAAADIVVSRAGANSLSELAYLGKACILIPLSSAANAHQDANAAIFQKSEAALVLNENNLTSNKLFHQIMVLLENRELVNKFSENIRNLAQKDASLKIAERVKNIIEEK